MASEKENHDFEKIKSASMQPPSAVEVERQVLGAMLLDNDSIPRVFEILKVDSFFDPKHRFLFSSIQSLYEANEPVDTITLYEELNKDGKTEEVGGVAYITKLSQDISSAANVDYHARIILEKWILRKLITTSLEVAGSAYEGKDDVFDLLDDAETKMFGISQEGTKESFTSMDKAVKEALELIEAIHANKLGTFSVSSNYHHLDDILGGFQKSDLIIIAARPSMGKTALALSVARNAAVQDKVPVAIFSLEMSTIQLATRLISAEAKIDAQNLRTGRFKASDGPKISKTVHKLGSAPIYIDDTPGLTVLEMRAKARRLKKEKNVGMIIIDYLQLMSGSGKVESREREISIISRSLKALAKELNVPVLALSQLNRSVESTTDKRPMLSHLRESGAIEQDADVVLFLYRPEVYRIETYPNGDPTEGVAEIIVAKQRNGPTGDIKLKFIKEYARFENLDIYHGDMPQVEEQEYPTEKDIPF
ncbi:MAG: replicative DNA helicase [Bacteroidota bacterium]